MADTDIKDFDPSVPGNNVSVFGVSIAQGATQTAQIDDAVRSVLSVVAGGDWGTIPVLADIINESTLDAGVTIDGLLILNGSIDFGTIGLLTDLITESTLDAGVTVEGVLLENGGLTATALSTFQANAEVQGQGYSPTQTLTDVANIAWNLDSGNAAQVTLAGNRTLDNPTNMQDGGTYILKIIQDGTGSRTLAYGTAYKFPNSVDPVLSTGATEYDRLYCVSDGISMDCTVAYNFG